MSKQQFDTIIKEKLAQLHYVPSDEGWADLQDKIANTKNSSIATSAKTEEGISTNNKSFVWKWKRLAAVLLPLMGIASIWAIYNYKPNNTNHANNALTQTKPATINLPEIDRFNPAKTSITNNTEAIATIEKNAKSTQSQIQEKTIYKSLHNNLPVAFTNSSNQNFIQSKSTIIENNNTPQQNNLAIQMPSVDTNKIATTTNKQKNDVVNKDAIVIAKEASPKMVLPFDIQTPNAKDAASKAMHYSVVGSGMINNNTYSGNGFNIGVSAEKNITSKIYVDATLAVGRNNPTWLQNTVTSNLASSSNNMSLKSTLGASNDDFVNPYGVNPSTNSFMSGGNNIPVEELTTDEAIADAVAYRLASYQMELAPMVGYKVKNKLNIAAGLDVAKIIKDKDYNNGVNRILLHTNQAPIVNTWDMGMIAKAEFQITRKIILGYKHRQGVTSITKGNGNNSRRNFDGLVMKYRIK